MTNQEKIDQLEKERVELYQLLNRIELEIIQRREMEDEKSKKTQ